MRWRLATAGLLCITIAFTALLVSSQDGSAHTQRGAACADQNGGAGNHRFFHLTEDGSATAMCDGDGNHRAGDAWETNAGSCITVEWRDQTVGALPPLAPNKVTLQLLADNGATVVRTYQSLAAEPADGTNFDACATSDGTAGGSPRTGVFRLFLRAVKDDAPGGVGNYDINSDTQAHRGALRSQLVVNSASASSPPSGSIFAFGPAGNEDVTLTVTYAQPVMDNNAENTQICVRRTVLETPFECGTNTDTDSGTTTRISTIDLTYDAASTAYGLQFSISGNGVLNAGFFGDDALWTVMAAGGHAAGVTRFDNVLVFTGTLFTADPRITFDTNGVSPSDGDWTISAFTLWNRGETLTYTGSLLNARDQVLTRTMTIDFRHSGGSIGTVSDTGNPYTGTFTIPTSAAATQDTTGTSYFLRATATDQTKDSDTGQFFVSSLYKTHPHPQLQEPLEEHDVVADPSQGHNVKYVISVDVVHAWCHVRGVRDQNIDTGGSTPTVSILDPSQTPQGSSSAQTQADGWQAETPHLDFAAVAPSGTWTVRCTVSSNGNSDVLGASDVSIQFTSAFTANLNIRVVVDSEIALGATYRFFWHIERDGNASTPDTIPMYDVAQADGGDPETWNTLASGRLLNVLDDTETINGALYYLDFTPTSTGYFNIEAQAIINGALIRRDFPFEVLPLTAFEELTGLTAIEFSLFPAMAIAGIWIWSRSTDPAVQALGALLPMAAGALLVSFVATGLAPWAGTVGFAAALFMIGAYLLVRLFLDNVLARGNSP